MAGYCAGYGMPGAMNPVGGRGARGGGGRGWRHWFYASGLPGWARAGAGVPAWGAPAYPPAAPRPPEMSDEAEMAALKAQSVRLEQTLHAMRQRIQILEGAAKPE
jgi:hypothetical protein